MIVDETVDDPYCDPDHPVRIRFDEVEAAARRIAGHIVRTPCRMSHMSQSLGMHVYLKHEGLQYTGSFKGRGVRNTLMLLSEEEKTNGVISASTGNHGLAMSYHAGHMNLPCVIVVPTQTSLGFINRCERRGVHVIQHGEGMMDCETKAMALKKEKRLTYINGYDHPNMIAGVGSIGIEIIHQLPAVDAVLVPTGGGALLAGVAIAIKNMKPETKVYGIETEKTCSMTYCLRKNERVFSATKSSIANSLAIPMVGVNSFHNLKDLVDRMVVVREDWVARAIMRLLEEERVVVEGAGAVGLAAIMAGLLPHLKGKRVVCILTGGNIDPAFLSRSLERGMASEGRLLKFSVGLHDKPGSMADFCALLGGLGVTIRDCVPERAWMDNNVFTVELSVIVETKGWEHAKKMVQMVRKHYSNCHFPELGKQDKPGHDKIGVPCLAPVPVCMRIGQR